MGLMFPFDADCTSCRYLIDTDYKDGKYYCEKKHEYVSANDRICGMAAEKMGRCESDKKRLRNYSKDHGYYVVTAITEILGLPEDNDYMETFVYLRDVVMTRMEEYQGFIEDYENDGPHLADLLRYDEDREGYAEYLIEVYLSEFVRLISGNSVDEAVATYSSMLDAIKERYGYRREDVKHRELREC